MFSKDRKKGAGAAPPSIVSADAKVKGDVISAGDLQVDGVIDGDVKAIALTVGATGVVNGAVTAESALIRGTVTGPVRVPKITLARSCRVTGDILHEQLTIEPGAYVEGHCRRMDKPPALPEPKINLVVGEATTLDSSRRR